MPSIKRYNGATWDYVAPGSGAIYPSFRHGFLPGSANLIGATTEPTYAVADGTNFDYAYLDFIGTASPNQGVFFSIPLGVTRFYTGGSLKIDIDIVYVGTPVTNETVIFACGVENATESAAYDDAPPTTGDGYSTVTWTLDGNVATGDKYTKTITIAAASGTFSASNAWRLKLTRLADTDTNTGAARVIGWTVYE